MPRGLFLALLLPIASCRRPPTPSPSAAGTPPDSALVRFDYHIARAAVQRVAFGQPAPAGLQLQLGRFFFPVDTLRADTAAAVISDALWQRIGAGDDILGKVIAVDGRLTLVVGIAAPAPTPDAAVQLWLLPRQ
jgi:hypothetical protein